MPGTRSSTKSEDLVVDVREEVRKALEVNHDLLDTLVAKVKQTLIDELTDTITTKVADALKETYGFELGEKDKRINDLEQRVDDLENQRDDADQYSRRNCLVFHGLEEKEGENTDEVLKNFCKDKLGVSIENSDIDRSHRLGTQKQDKKRGIIMKFSNYNTRNVVYQSRSKLRRLKAPPFYYIQENLTKARSDLFWKVKKNYKDRLKSIWTQDGRIKVITADDRRITLTRVSHIEKI